MPSVYDTKCGILHFWWSVTLTKSCYCDHNYIAQSIQAWVAEKSDIVSYYIIHIFPENSNIAPPNPVSCSNLPVTLTSCLGKTLALAFSMSYWTVKREIVYFTDLKHQNVIISLNYVNKIQTLQPKSNLDWKLLNTLNVLLTKYQHFKESFSSSIFQINCLKYRITSFSPCLTFPHLNSFQE